MTKTDYLEIYKQRYETFRHLDRLQWQMLQIAVGAASVILVVLARNDSELEWWMFTVFWCNARAVWNNNASHKTRIEQK